MYRDWRERDTADQDGRFQILEISFLFFILIQIINQTIFQLYLLVKRDSELLSEVIVYSNSFRLNAAYPKLKLVRKHAYVMLLFQRRYSPRTKKEATAAIRSVSGSNVIRS